MRGGVHSFAQVPAVSAPRSVFNRSHGHKTTFNAGYLIPVYVDEALPGDTVSLTANLFARLATPIFPLMDNLYLEVFFFFCPNRLLWTDWVRCMGERLNPADSIDYQVPQVMAPGGGFTALSLFDYLGMPTGVANIGMSALWPRAYNRIWNEWFRDENLQTRATENTGAGPDASTDYVVRRRGKRHDYFTSALPWPQKQTASVTLPLGTSAPVIPVTPAAAPTFKGGNTGTAYPLYHTTAQTAVTMNSAGATGDLYWSDTKLQADLTQATAATINAIREAFQVQKLLERDARGGTRYVELLRSHFGVVSPDFRLQRPEFLGGGSVPISVNPVVQTSSTDATSPQGNLAAYAVANGRAGFTKSFTEHGVLLGLAMVRADLGYQQGIPRMFSRRTRYDFYWPAFANLGEQAVKNQEIYAQGNATDQLAFGYQERWAEYRYAESRVSGQFRSTHATPLDSWHLAQKFLALPTLGDTFIQEDPPLARVVADVADPHLIFDGWFNVRHVRPIPMYSVPGMLDHF